ncbi:MAG: aminotransferase class V-fold PLP-dependent enzyme [Geothrix sp.]|uniref:cysteine desulfurase family protein n=1 Tax=Geothrix sp. TaxID=1962974 RepID=UPI0017A971EC|nr:aminotransferase class V-fold PLP-dependent enzyme [Geothrix sp.]NWJ39835.1 aminotransferase class V-fold PLP-dependent enzyme [Geothrix sp.]WIL22152.1 MAG: aminotransferase class V-fold PLP-dependent enzyme [Geothrix sp.]
MPRLYFDANASAPPHPEAVEAVRRAMAEDWANPTSTHREGQRARFRLEEARRELAASLSVAPGELVFCASATEALFLLIRGLQPALGDRPAAAFPGEHSACLNPLRDWSRLAWLPELPPDCATVVQMAANNETGLLYAMPALLDAVRIKDCCQAWGKVPVELSDCDAAVFSGHKMGGPRGAALLWLRPGLPWEIVMEGPQERRRRGGTEDLPAILGLAAAARHLTERQEMNAALAPLRDAFETEVTSRGGDIAVIGQGSPRLPNTSCILFKGRNGEALHASLDLAGFAVSTGSACHSGSVKPSHAITTLGYSLDDARSVLRFSMLPDAQPSEVEALAAAIKRLT